jgi:hypothetical protein
MHPTEYGYITEIIRDEYIRHQIRKNPKKKDCLLNDESVLSLDARPESNRVYFWQLFSILGKEKILSIVTTFYGSVFADDQDLRWEVVDIIEVARNC